MQCLLNVHGANSQFEAVRRKKNMVQDLLMLNHTPVNVSQPEDKK